MIYGYCRISTSRQSIERQVKNIQKEYPDAHIIKEIYTGTGFSVRKEFENLMKTVSIGDKIVFDSVSRMSRKYKFYDSVNIRFAKTFYCIEKCCQFVFHMATSLLW